jgi:hypothetical protein
MEVFCRHVFSLLINRHLKAQATLTYGSWKPAVRVNKRFARDKAKYIQYVIPQL